MAMPYRVLSDLRDAHREMELAVHRGVFGTIGRPCAETEIQAAVQSFPELPLDVIEWYRMCGFATFSSEFIYGPVSTKDGMSIYSMFDAVKSVSGRVPLAADQFGCIYCVDALGNNKGTSSAVFLTEFASHETINYHVASCFSKFLKLISRSVTIGLVDWVSDSDFVVFIDPEILDIENVILPRDE